MRFIIWVILLIFALPQVHGQEEIDTSTESSSIERYQKFDEDVQINAIIVDAQNDKWLGTNKGLYKFSAINSDREMVTEDFGVYALAQHKNFGIWAGTDKGHLVDSDLQFRGKVNLPFKGEIKSMSFYKNMLWIGTTDGIYLFNPKLNKFSRHYTRENSKLQSDTINLIYVDPKNVLWVGTNDGLVRIKKKNWKVYNAGKNEQFQAATHSDAGIWMVSDKELHLIDIYDGYRWYPAALKQGLHRGEVKAMASDSKGRIYLASELLVQFDPYKNETNVFNQEQGFTSSAAMALVTDQNDDIWIGTANRGVFRVDNASGSASRLKAIAVVDQGVKCAGAATGIVSVKVSGGKKPYNYKWNTKGKTGSKIKGLTAKKYVVTVTDAEKNKYVANVQLKEPRSIVLEILEQKSISDVYRADGYVRIKVDGGTPDYRALWDSGKRGFELKNAKYGNHLLRVTDANGCKSEIGVFIDKPKDFADLDVTNLTVGQTLRINQLRFAADSFKITDDSYPILDDVFAFLKTNPNVIVEIGGHTNGIPPHDYCDRLSSARARNVALYLQQKGIDAKNITYKGYGKRKPIATNQSRAGRAKNQRVEVKILEMK